MAETTEEMKNINASEKYTKKYDPEEISPLKQPKQVTNATNQDISVNVSDSPEANPPKKKTKYKIAGNSLLAINPTWSSSLQS